MYGLQFVEAKMYIGNLIILPKAEDVPCLKIVIWFSNVLFSDVNLEDAWNSTDYAEAASQRFVRGLRLQPWSCVFKYNLVQQFVMA